jgi:ACR3 family arsenite transporter
MVLQALRDRLESGQVGIYFLTVACAAVIGWAAPGTESWESIITPALAVMLFATFLQVPLGDLGRGCPPPFLT